MSAFDRRGNLDGLLGEVVSLELLEVGGVVSFHSGHEFANLTIKPNCEEARCVCADSIFHRRHPLASYT